MHGDLVDGQGHRLYAALFSDLSITPLLARETPNCFFPDQHNNRDNNEAHYLGTGREILRQGTFRGVGEEFRIDRFGDGQRGDHFSTVRDGRFHPLE